MSTELKFLLKKLLLMPEDHFTVTSSSEIRNDVRVAEIVTRELEKAKPESGDTCRFASFGHHRRRDRHVCPGHFWLLKFGKVPSRNRCVEKKFKLGTRKYEEYEGVRF
jgi:hypothetical protein